VALRRANDFNHVTPSLVSYRVKVEVKFFGEFEF